MTMGDQGDNRTELERAIAERAREFAAGQTVHRPQRYWLYPVGLVLAAGVVFIVFFGFDTFLGSMQKVIEIIVAEDEVAEDEVAADEVVAPVPVFIVPDPPPP